MKKFTAAILLSIPALCLMTACQDEISEVGNTLSRGEVTISVDTLKLNLNGHSDYSPKFDARAATNLLGRLQTEEYGELDCSYVTRLLPTPALGIPSDIPEEQIDSMKVIITVPRGSLAGDSLAPQQVKVYRLTSQIPSDIDNAFDPTGYFSEETLLGSKNFTLSALALSSSNYASDKAIQIRVPLSRESALEVVRKYRTEPEVFQWPSTFAQWIPGIYVAHSFGRGCVANVTQTKSCIYYHYDSTEVVVEDGHSVTKPVVKVDSVTNFVTSPAVLSSNRVSYSPSSLLQSMAVNKCVVTAPGGFVTRFRFPAEEILKKYNEADHSLTVVANLIMTLPASKIEGKVDINVPPTLAMIPTSKVDEFFANQQIPDNVTSFWGTYSSSKGTYTFTSMRQFITNLAQKGISSEDELDYTLVPVLLGTETSSDGSVTSVTSCTPYMASPAMTVLDTEKASFVFTFSRQILK